MLSSPCNRARSLENSTMAFTAPENTTLNTARPSANRPPLPIDRSRWLWLATTALSALCFVALVAHPAHAQDRDAAPRQKTESPYFFVKSDNPGVDQLPLKSTHVDVRVSGVIADVTVVQTYKNEGQRAIEAKYVFPGSTRAAVHGMNVRLADRLITAKIREKQQARLEYDRQEGRQDRRPAGTAPTQCVPDERGQHHARRRRQGGAALHRAAGPTDGNYQFVFPTVVGPRYNSPQSSQANATWVAQPFLPKGQATAPQQQRPGV
jgi:Ca-activated chloride channel family protein